MKFKEAAGRNIELVLGSTKMGGAGDVSFECLKVDWEKARVVTSTYLTISQKKTEAKDNKLKVTDLVKAGCELKVCDVKNAYTSQDFA